MTSYSNRNSTGTVTVTQGSADVVGAGTNVLTDGVLQGDMFVHDNTQTVAFIDSITDDNHFAFDKPWKLANGVDQTFTIYRIEQLVRLGTAHKILLDVLSTLENFGGTLIATSGLPDNANGEDGNIRLDPVTGQLYNKDNGVWSLSANIKSVDGLDGMDGVDGKSNYQLWLEDGNVGTVADYLKTLQADAIHSIDGFFERLSAPIIPQNYPAGLALPAEFTATFFHAEILNGEVGSKCDITIMAGGVNYYGPVTVEHGSQNSASGAALAVIPKGLSPSVRIDKIVGNVHVVGVTLSGVLA